MCSASARPALSWQTAFPCPCMPRDDAVALPVPLSLRPLVCRLRPISTASVHFVSYEILTFLMRMRGAIASLGRRPVRVPAAQREGVTTYIAVGPEVVARHRTRTGFSHPQAHRRRRDPDPLPWDPPFTPTPAGQGL